MKTIKNVFVALCCMGALVFASQGACAQDVSAENYKELIKERKKIAKMTRKQVEANSWKEAKKVAKQLKKDGWKPMPGSPTLEMQQNDLLMRRYEQGEGFPRYILGSGQAFANVAGVARKQAEARARAALATNIGSEVASLVEEATTNVEYSSTDQETISKFVDTNMSKVQQSIGRTEVVFQAFREVNGSVEVLVYVCYDGARAKKDILNMFDEDHKEMREVVMKMLDNASK